MAKKKSSSGLDFGNGGDGKPYVVLARKYRPSTFDDLIGQEAMVQTLTNAFKSGRIAQGYMLTGVRGVGKTTTARILARALNYEAEGIDKPVIEMPELGRHCAEIMESRHPDVIEMDAASNTGVDNVREIIESARYRPLMARYKVFIIDEVHMLSKGAFNALLKTLEEPPEHVKFIFATTEIRKVPVTVLSRCQRFDLRRVDVPVLAEHFKKILAAENAKGDDEALSLIARAAEGSVRDGLSILDQAIAMGQGKVSAEIVRVMLGLADRGRVFDLLDKMFAGNTAGCLEAFAALHRDGADPTQLLADLAEAVHIVTRTKVAGAATGADGLSAEERRRASVLASALSVPLLARAWQMLVKGLEETGRAPDTVAAAEMVLIRIAHTADLPTPDDLIKALGGGTVSSNRGAPPPRESGHDERAPLNQAPPPAATLVPPASVTSDDRDAANMEAFDRPDDLFDEMDDIGPAGDFAASPVEAGDAAAVRAVTSFADVVALAGAQRDVKLKMQLEEYVSLVKFDAAAGSIDFFLLSGGPQELANDLREKLNRWTGRRWVVVLSKNAGAPAIGPERRRREAAELEILKQHPLVKAVLAEFPDAKISEVRRIAPLGGASAPGHFDDETGT